MKSRRQVVGVFVPGGSVLMVKHSMFHQIADMIHIQIQATQINLLFPVIFLSLGLFHCNTAA